MTPSIVTIHILPYWEDFLIRAKYAAIHVDPSASGWGGVSGKEILIGDRLAERGADARGARCRAPTKRVVSRSWRWRSGKTSASTLIEAYDRRGSASSRAPSAATGA
jgi:glucan 1,3-beta-glucosidase